MFDLHTHDEFSTFDGFGKAEERAQLAKEYHYNSICTTNHGNTNGLVSTYQAAKKYDLKAILGVEGYFLPKYVENKRGYHLILLAKNLNGYHNLNVIQTEGEKQKYYNPIWTFDLLEKYHDDLICTAACVASYSSQCIIKGDFIKAKMYLMKMQDIFGDDFYIEIQPYKISEIGLQEKVNVELIKLSKELRIFNAKSFAEVFLYPVLKSIASNSSSPRFFIPIFKALSLGLQFEGNSFINIISTPLTYYLIIYSNSDKFLHHYYFAKVFHIYL